MEFPEKGKDFFAELLKQKIDKERVLRDLRIASALTPANEYGYVVLLLPMRRSHAGELTHHVAVWCIDPENAQHLRNASPDGGDWERLKQIKHEINELTYRIFERLTLSWCQVLEDRPEIVVRRDANRPMASFLGRKVLILGCGALGSWAAEMLARAGCKIIDLVDDAIVKPGLLIRQNYVLEDIGANKAEALAKRLTAISNVSVRHFDQEGHAFVFQDVDRFNGYDLVFDCTASSIFQMKLERDWKGLKGNAPPTISFVTDATARHCISIQLARASASGVWDAYIRLKHRLCIDGKVPEIVDAFYGDKATKALFQPEPGCSDPTFSGSSADMSNLVSTCLNVCSEHVPSPQEPIGVAFPSASELGRPKLPFSAQLEAFEECSVGNYRVRTFQKVFRETKAWVRNNNRIRSKECETGGLLWGLWDDAVGIIWIFDASGPPPDSEHSPGHFICGTLGTADEHKFRMQRSHGASGFIGFWHTHPEMRSEQSGVDIRAMEKLVSEIGENQKRALMLIFGRNGGVPSAGIYVYESRYVNCGIELMTVGSTQITLKSAIV